MVGRFKKLPFGHRFRVLLGVHASGFRVEGFGFRLGA